VQPRDPARAAGWAAPDGPAAEPGRADQREPSVLLRRLDCGPGQELAGQRDGQRIDRLRAAAVANHGHGSMQRVRHDPRGVAAIAALREPEARQIHGENRTVLPEVLVEWTHFRSRCRCVDRMDEQQRAPRRSVDVGRQEAGATKLDTLAGQGRRQRHETRGTGFTGHRGTPTMEGAAAFSAQAASP
jgi:hypothetical protein